MKSQNYTFFTLILVTLFLQNEPNFKLSGSKLSAVITGGYNERSLPGHDQNEPNRTQSNPIRTQFQNGQKQTPTSVVAGTYNEKPTFCQKITNPNQTQYEPKNKPNLHAPHTAHLTCINKKKVSKRETVNVGLQTDDGDGQGNILFFFRNVRSCLRLFGLG